MGKINVLPDRIIGKIAAGEVVERPASVVKECIENSLDANAGAIIVEIKKAGKVLISVRDDGDGIEPDDMEKLFKRHATSKIREMEDLYAIRSLGFRGEALYTIGSVADVVIISSQGKNGGAGTEIHVRGGERISARPAGRPRGTTIEIRELFFNTPARRKFLRSDQAEFRQILSVFIPYCISLPEKRFSLSHNGRESAVYAPSAGMLQRICAVLGLDEKNLLQAEREFPEDGFSARLFLGDINLRRPRRDQQFVFVNGRPVYSQGISYAINQTYRSMMPRDVYPVFVAFVDLPCENIDANVHPSKKEVKLKNEAAVSSAISSFITELLTGKGHAAEVKRVSVYFPTGKGGSLPARQSPLSERKWDESIFGDGRENQEEREEAASLPLKSRLREAVYAGRYRNKYLFFESGDVLLVIDQHAAHERINFEKLKREFESGKVGVQQLLSPMIIKMNPEEMSAWEDGEKTLEDIGFHTTRWDTNSVALHAMPLLIRNPELSLRSILAEKNIFTASREKLARKACRGSVLAGEKVTEEEAARIKDDLLKCDMPLVCPHGRPTVVEFSESFFDRQFLR